MARPKTDPRLLKARGSYRRHPEREPARKGKGRREVRRPRRDYAGLISGYVGDVIAGKIPACKWVKAACRRHLEDLKRAESKSYPYEFDVKAAAAVLSRMERYPHIKGQLGGARRADSARGVAVLRARARSSAGSASATASAGFARPTLRCRGRTRKAPWQPWSG